VLSLLLTGPVFTGLTLALAVIGFFCLGYAAGYAIGKGDGGKP
jgi:hypothetical protein